MAARERSAALVAPALATRVDAVPTGREWLHELKIDGYDQLEGSIIVEDKAAKVTYAPFLLSWPSPDFVDGLTTLLEPVVHTPPG